MAKLCTVGIALWPRVPRIQVTASVMCRESGVVCTGTAEGSIWLWRTPPEWAMGLAGKGGASGGGGGGGDEVEPFAVLCGEHKAGISSLSVTTEGGKRVLASVDMDACMCIWRISDGVCIRSCRGFLPWVPSSLHPVSCKGKCLVACIGGSPDIEVFDIISMRRLLRLFGHGEWCASICTAYQPAPQGGSEGARDAEPTIFSIDRGGTLCCWLPDRSCAKGVVGWIPSVQVHCVPVSFPTSLALDAASKCLLVVGIGECVCYPIDPKDLKVSDRTSKPRLIEFGDAQVQEAKRSLLHEAVKSDDASEASSPEKLRRQRHASVAASRPPLKRWNSAPATDIQSEIGSDGIKSRAEGQAVGTEASSVMDVVTKQEEMHNRGLSDLQRWTRVSAVVMPGGVQAVVWEQGAGMYLVNLTESRARVVVGREGRAVEVAGDVQGWMVVSGEDGDISVWSPHSLQKAFKESAQPNMSAHAALRERLKKDAHKDAGGRDGEPEGGDVPVSPQSSKEGQAPPEAPQSASPQSVSANLEVVKRIPESMAGLAKVCFFAGGGSLASGWEEAAGAAGRAGRMECDVSCTLLKVEGATAIREDSVGGGSWSNKRAAAAAAAAAERAGLEVRGYWVVALRSGRIDVHELPQGSVCARLAGHGCACGVLMWPENKGVLVSGADDGSVMVWRVKDSKLLHTMRHHTARVTSLSVLDHASSQFGVNTVLCSCAADRSIVLSSLDVSDSHQASGGALRLLGLLQGHSSIVSNVVWAKRHGQLYGCCVDGSIHVWQMPQEHHPAQLIRVVPAASASLVLAALDRKTPHLGTAQPEGSSSSLSGSWRGVRDDDTESNARDGCVLQTLWDDEEDDSIEYKKPFEVAVTSSHCEPSILMIHADIISVLASQAASSKHHKQGQSPSPPSPSPSTFTPSRGEVSPVSLPSPATSNRSVSGNIPINPASPASRQDTAQQQQQQQQQHTPTGTTPPSPSRSSDAPRRPPLQDLGSSLYLGLSSLLSLITSLPQASSKTKASIAAALSDLGVGCLLSPQYTGSFDASGAFIPAPFQASLVAAGAGSSRTCLVPRASKDGAAFCISDAFTSFLATSAAVLLDTCRALCPPNSRGGEASGELLTLVVKGMAGRLRQYCDADVIALAKYWLLAPDSARQAAHLQLTATLGRTDSEKRKQIVEEWTGKLIESARAKEAANRAQESTGSKVLSDSQLLGQRLGNMLPGNFPNPSSSPAQTSVSLGGDSDGFSGKNGPALVVLAVIGSHFQEALDKTTCGRVADALVKAVSSNNSLHAKVASHLLARGAQIWAPHVKDGEGLMRVLYARYWRFSDFQTTMADTEWALGCVAPALPAQFVEVVGEEASRHSQLVCHVWSERSVAAIKVLVALFKKKPMEMMPALPRAVEVVLRTLDPSHPLVRQAVMQHSTAALKEIVRKFPMAAFHQETQRFAVGTVDALIVIYDLRTASKWRVLEGHEGAISAVAFDAGGHRLASFSCDEGRVRYWEAGTSGPFGLFGSKVGRCVQQFTVPQSQVPKIAKGSPDSLGFRMVFTPSAIILTRDSVPLCEFSIA